MAWQHFIYYINDDDSLLNILYFIFIGEFPLKNGMTKALS
jgi:hypothetical protein